MELSALAHTLNRLTPPIALRLGAKALYALPRPVKARLGSPQTVDGNELGLDSQLTLRLLQLQGIGGLAPTNGDVRAARRAMRVLSSAVGDGLLPEVVARQLTVDGADGPLQARLYTPPGLAALSPLVVFFHGGGFVVGDLDTHDGACRYIADRGRVRVLAVDYLLAPEAVFPAAADDAVTATRWAIDHAEQLGADPARVAVAGDSAGGNLSAVVARELAVAGGLQPVFSLLFYPVTTGEGSASASRVSFASGYFLTKADIDWFGSLYTPDKGQDADPKYDVLNAVAVPATGRTHVVVAGFDPLRDEGLAFAEHLHGAGVDVTTQLAPGSLHGFLNQVAVSSEARSEVDAALDVLRQALSQR